MLLLVNVLMTKYLSPKVLQQCFVRSPGRGMVGGASPIYGWLQIKALMFMLHKRGTGAVRCPLGPDVVAFRRYVAMSAGLRGQSRRLGAGHVCMYVWWVTHLTLPAVQ
uniref:Uncharacterized protein n=1 Tax=Eutreptiella gymnastica TaxID=73025 RepID=A0A7S4D115_9EUGL